jgi:hypothetical protein
MQIEQELTEESSYPEALSDRDVTRIQTDMYYNYNTSQVLQYSAPTSSLILQMSMSEDNEKSKPFMQRIQLKGPEGTIVRATGQVDDGVMKNCILLTRWEQYGHCLNALKKSQTVIGVANTTKIKSKGTWTGIVQV